MAQLVKNLPAVWEAWVRSLGWEDPLEKGKATHSSILAWRILWTVYSMWLQRVGHDWVTFSHSFTYIKCLHTITILSKTSNSTYSLLKSLWIKCWNIWDLLQYEMVVGNVLRCSGHVRLFSTLWIAVRQAPLSMEFSRIPECVAMPSSRESSQPRDESCISI